MGAVARRTPVGAWLLVAVLAAALQGGAAAAAAEVEDGPGILWVHAGARGGGAWAAGPDSAVSCLSWPGGMLVVPRLAPRLAGADGAIGVAYAAGRYGFTGGRRLLFTPGRFAVRAPLLLSDGSLQLFVSRGELEIAADRVVVRADGVGRADSRAGLLLGLGMLVVVGVLIVRGRALARQA